MSWLRYVSHASKDFNGPLASHRLCAGLIRIAVALGDLVDVFADPLKDRQPALRQFGEGSRHGDARVGMGAKAAVEMGVSRAGCFPCCGDERGHLHVGRDVADDQANASGQKSRGEPRGEIWQCTDVDYRNSLSSEQRRGCPTAGSRRQLSRQRRWRGCADEAFRGRSPTSTRLSRSPPRGRDRPLLRWCFPRPARSCCRETPA